MIWLAHYIYFLKNKKGTFNIGFENFSINKISSIIKKINKHCKVIKNKSIDLRSYRLHSNKILKSGFRPKKNL